MTTEIDEFLEHYGVKGMKWGVRKDRGHEGQRAKTKKIAKLDKKYEKEGMSFSTAMKIWNEAASAANNDLPAINERFRGQKGLDIPGSPANRRYMDAVLENMDGHLRRAGAAQGTNASGTRQITARLNDAGNGVYLNIEDVRHAEIDQISAKFVFDDDGFIIRIELPNDLKQSVELGEEFLEHYGVKGMKWGVRKKRDSSRTVYEKSPSRLTDDELKKRIARLEQEKRYNELNRRDVSQGERLATEILTNVGRAAVTTVATGAALYGVRVLLERNGVDPSVARGMTRRGK